MPDKLDEISRAIGRVDAYVHEFRHGTNNVMQMIQASELSATKRHETLKIELSNQIEKAMTAMRSEIAAIAARVAILEERGHRQEGAISVWKWLGAHWPFAAVATAIVGFVAWANGKLHL